MTQVAIIVPVVEEHDTTPYGQYIKLIDMPRVPVAGEWVVIASRGTVAQNVIWHVEGEVADRVEVYLTQRPLGPSFSETINELFDAGFLPINPQDGTTLTWEEDAELRQAASEAYDEEPVAVEDEAPVPHG